MVRGRWETQESVAIEKTRRLVVVPPTPHGVGLGQCEASSTGFQPVPDVPQVENLRYVCGSCFKPTGRGRAAAGLLRPVEIGTDVEHRLVVVVEANQSVAGHLQVVGHPDRDRRDGGEYGHVQPVEPLRA